MSVDAVLSRRAPYALHHGECLAWMRTLPAASVDAIVSDLPYAEIDRDYGRMSEVEWEAFAHAAVRESLRILKPRGSAVFIVQPNSERVGRMRAWCFRFLAWCADDLVRETGGRVGLVQDAYWWNIAAAPTVHCRRENGLMRGSVKPAVWVGPEDCYRAQDEVLWSESERNVAMRAGGRALRESPSRMQVRPERIGSVAAERGGGVTPFNVLPLANANSADSAGAHGHGAGTPYDLAAWWVRYLCPKGGVVVDPCGGDMTMGLAAVRQGRRFLGCEKMRDHYDRGARNMARCDLDATTPVAAPSADFGPLFGGTS